MWYIRRVEWHAVFLPRRKRKIIANPSHLIRRHHLLLFFFFASLHSKRFERIVFTQVFSRPHFILEIFKMRRVCIHNFSTIGMPPSDLLIFGSFGNNLLHLSQVACDIPIFLAIDREDPRVGGPVWWLSSREEGHKVLSLTRLPHNLVWPSLNWVTLFLCLALSTSRPSKRNPNSDFWNSFRCLFLG